MVGAGGELELAQGGAHAGLAGGVELAVRMAASRCGALCQKLVDSPSDFAQILSFQLIDCFH